MKTEKIALYCRVSTEKQEKEETIKDQLYILNAIYKGKNVVAQYLDDGYRGGSMERPAMVKLKEDAKAGKFNVLAISDLDRFTRGGVSHLEPAFKNLISLGIKIEVRGMPIDYTSPEGIMSADVLSSVGKYGKNKAVQIMVNGKWARADRGILIGCYPSWGYKLIRKHWEGNILKEAYFEKDLAEDWKIKKIFETYLKEQGLHKTSRELYKMGIYARGKKGEEGKYKNYILPSTIRQILINESYIGKFYFGKKIYGQATKFVKKYSKTRERGGNTGWKWRSRDKWKLIKIPPIINKETFNSVQNILKKRAENFLRKAKYNYLCQNLIRCIHCGRAYRAKPNGKFYSRKDGVETLSYSYFCYSNEGIEKKCPSCRVNGRFFDEIVWDTIRSYVSNPEEVKIAITESENRKIEEKDTTQKDLNLLLLEKAKNAKEKYRIIDCIGRGIINEGDARENLSILNEKEEKINNKEEELSQKIKKIKEIKIIEKEIEKSCKIYSNIINSKEELPFDIKKWIVRTWVSEINIKDDGNAIIKVKIPEILGKPVNIENISNSIMGQIVCFNEIKHNA